jgi:hypothetical protein
MHTKKSPADWFRHAKTAYVQRHQECAWCGNVHQVRQTIQGSKHAFNCQRCDFQVSFDAATGRYHMVPGEVLSPVSSTMFDEPIANLL